MILDNQILTYSDKEVIFTNICQNIYGVNNCPISFSIILPKLENINDPKIIEDIIRKYIEDFNNSQNIQSCIETSSYWDYFTVQNVAVVVGVIAVVCITVYVVGYYWNDSGTPPGPPSGSNTEITNNLDSLKDVVNDLSSLDNNQDLTNNLDSLKDVVNDSSAEILESSFNITIGPEGFMPTLNEILQPTVSIIGPESIKGPHFQYMNPVDDHLLMNFVNSINRMSDPEQQAILISLLQDCIDVGEMFEILLMFC